MITLIFWLLAGHFIGDYILQPEIVAINKRWTIPKTDGWKIPWYYWMLAHSFMQGALVALATGNAVLGFGEVVLHFLIDCGKVEGLYGHHVDQALHILCKALWLALIALGGHLWTHA